MSRRESSSETRWDVGCCEATGKSAGQQEGGSGRRCDSGSHRVERPVHQLQQATGCWLSLSRAGRALTALRLENEELYQPNADWCSHCMRMLTWK